MLLNKPRSFLYFYKEFSKVREQRSPINTIFINRIERPVNQVWLGLLNIGTGFQVFVVSHAGHQ